MDNTIITIGREFGSGGHEIGEKVAARLGFAFYDADLLVRAAEHSGLSAHIIGQFDEEPMNPLLHARRMAVSQSEPFGVKVLLAQFDAIRAIAEKESAVIVGRCADYVLLGHGGLLSVFVTADSEVRIARIMRRNGIDRAAAQSLIAKKDRRRTAYYNYYTDKQWGAAQSYDLCLSSSLFGIDGAVELIARAVAAEKRGE